MADGRAELQWAQTAEVLCVLYNANRDPKRKRRPWKARDFNPYPAQATPVKKETLSQAEREEMRATFKALAASKQQPITNNGVHRRHRKERNR